MNSISKIRELYTQHNRKLVTYFDEDGSFEEQLKKIEDAGITVLKVDNNEFELNYQLETIYKEKEIFLYHPFKKPIIKNKKEYKLWGVMYANPELKTDPVTVFLEGFDIQKGQRYLAKKYIHILKYRTHQNTLIKILDNDHFNEPNLKKGLIAIALGLSSIPERNLLLARFVALSTEATKLSKIIEKLEGFETADLILNWMNSISDTRFNTLNEETVIAFIEILKYNAILGDIEPVVEDNYKKLKISKTATLLKLRDFIEDWQKDRVIAEKLSDTFNFSGKNIDESKLSKWYAEVSGLNFYSEASQVERLDILLEQTEFPTDMLFSELEALTGNSSILHDYETYIDYLKALSRFNGIIKAFSTFHLSSLDDYYTNYKNEFYKIDTAHRTLSLFYSNLKTHELDYNWVKSYDRANKAYDDYVIELNTHYQKLLQEIKFNFGNIEMEKQYDFYDNYIANAEIKTAVIISDALRYECGKELLDKFLQDKKNKVALKAALSSIPSYTNLGMSNLLPHQELELSQGVSDLVYKINGVSTISGNREKILRMQEPLSKTISANDYLDLDSYAMKDLHKEHKLLYVYHDWIDAIGDKSITEKETFNATSKALAELEILVTKLQGANFTRVLITSDHGFLYSSKKITEIDKQDFPSLSEKAKDHLRFAIAAKIEKSDGFKFKLKNTIKAKTTLEVALPMAVNRYKKGGNIGKQFVHGGASLQETIIPIIEIVRYKKEKRQEVTFRRIDSIRKMNSATLKVELLQNEAISNSLMPLEIIIGIYDNQGNVISSEDIVNLNASSTQPTDRKFSSILRLKSNATDMTSGFVKIFKSTDTKKLNPISSDVITINNLMGNDF